MPSLSLGVSSGAVPVQRRDTAPFSGLPVVSISADQVSAPEGDSGTTDFVFTLTRTGNLADVSSSVEYVVSGAATADDFVGGVIPAGTVYFAPDETEATITISVVGDATVEPNESFVVTLQTASDCTIDIGSASSVIETEEPHTVFTWTVENLFLPVVFSGETIVGEDVGAACSGTLVITRVAGVYTYTSNTLVTTPGSPSFSGIEDDYSASPAVSTNPDPFTVWVAFQSPTDPLRLLGLNLPVDELPAAMDAGILGVTLPLRFGGGYEYNSAGYNRYPSDWTQDPVPEPTTGAARITLTAMT